jgi:Flp pilus assembly protein TadG
VTSRRSEEGAVAIIVAIMLVVLMAAVALTVDVGGLYLRRRALVNGSDAAALSAARTCARGAGNDARFDTIEEAADYQAHMTAPEMTDTEVNGPIPNVTFPPPGGCAMPSQYGHTTVRYTSDQSLYFAPVLGFNNSSPVTTTATASWGFGSNNPVPIVLSSLLSVNCPVPPSGSPAPGQTCAFWYDNDRLNGGNFAFLSLNSAGWDVAIDSQCPGSQSGGTSRLTGWINGSIPASVSLNWTDPTYVCTDTGIRGVGGKDGPNSQVWGALHDLIDQTRDFPINWQGCGTTPPFTPCAPVTGAPDQAMVYNQDNIDKYDIIGFASLKIIDVVSVNEAQGGTGLCTTKNSTPYQWTSSGQTLDLDTITDSTAGWQGANGDKCPSRTPDNILSVTITKAKQSDPPCHIGPPAADACQLGAEYDYDAANRVITWRGAIPKSTKITFEWAIDPNNGPCGQLPTNSSAMCIVTEWQHSTLDPDFPPGTDNNTVIRLCDPAYGTCLDQR